MSKPKKCANEACTCISADGSKFCSLHCEGMAKKTELVCQCGHVECGVEVTRSAEEFRPNFPRDPLR